MVEIVSNESDTHLDPQSGNQLRALRTKFRLRHPLQNCYLFSHRVKLPDWGFEQQEVSCNKNPTLANSLWYIESNTHPFCTRFYCFACLFSCVRSFFSEVTIRSNDRKLVYEISDEGKESE